MSFFEYIFFLPPQDINTLNWAQTGSQYCLLNEFQHNEPISQTEVIATSYSFNKHRRWGFVWSRETSMTTTLSESAFFLSD